MMIQDIAKKVNDNYIVWFEKSNRWVQFEEPAWFVNSLQRKGVDKSCITQKFSKKYNLPRHEGWRFVNDICLQISALSKPTPKSSLDLSSSYYPTISCSTPYSIRQYIIGNKCFRIIFESRLAEYYIHPPLAYLETFHSRKPDITFEIHSNNNIPVLIEQDCHAYAFEDFMRLKKRLFIQMVNAMYNKINDDWLSFVHASALTDGKQTVLLSSASGSGKSTMAALLQTKGLTLVSDDFVPIDSKNKQAYPFPAAISVKAGSFDLLTPYYGDLHDRKFNNYEYTNKSVRYLPTVPNERSDSKARPIKSIVFIQYNPAVSCNFNLLPQNDAFKLFHEQAWVSSDPKHAKSFLNWFLKLQCYRLEYGDNQAGIHKILEIFKT